MAIRAVPDPPPFMPWRAFLKEFLRVWEQGEHVSILGPTGQGKSVLGLAILKGRARARRAHIVVLATKPRDRTMRRLGWPVVRDWPPGYGEYQVILWPRYGDPATAARNQRATFRPILQQLFKDGKRTLYIDEVFDFTERMQLTALLKELWRMGRANRLTLVASTQRPRAVPREMFSEPSWFFFFRTPDEDEVKRIGEIGGTDSRFVRELVRGLDEHEFLCVRARTGEMVRSKVRWGGKG